ncbi:hypothetical protein B0H11DRAFT_2053597 [Mycena galericulata]|nr:hypothetical protein B0H11DRAFT_2053597 [Mycena galericulata]
MHVSPLSHTTRCVLCRIDILRCSSRGILASPLHVSLLILLRQPAVPCVASSASSRAATTMFTTFVMLAPSLATLPLPLVATAYAASRHRRRRCRCRLLIWTITWPPLPLVVVSNRGVLVTFPPPCTPTIFPRRCRVPEPSLTREPRVIPVLDSGTRSMQKSDLGSLMRNKVG